MLRWIVLAVVVVALTAGATLLTQYAPNSDSVRVVAVNTIKGPQPKVEVPGPLTYEFGTMAQLSEGRHSWEFKNVGDADLELWLESSTCSCTIAKLKSADGEGKPRVVLKPNESTPIELEWQTKLFRDAFHKGATIGTNDPTRPSVPIYVDGKVYPPVITIPNDAVSFASVSNEEPNVVKIAVFSADRPDLKIEKLTTSRPEFLVARPRPLTPEECKSLKVKAGHHIDLEMKPGMPLGRFVDELVIQTDHPLNPQVKLAISSTVTGPVSVIPERVRMPGVTSREGASRDYTILVRGGRPTEFEVAHCPPKMHVKITPDDTPTQKGRYKMTVIVVPGTPSGPIEGELVLKTDHPKASQLTIPVSILISSASGG